MTSEKSEVKWSEWVDAEEFFKDKPMPKLPPQEPHTHTYRISVGRIFYDYTKLCWCIDDKHGVT